MQRPVSAAQTAACPSLVPLGNVTNEPVRLQTTGVPANISPRPCLICWAMCFGGGAVQIYWLPSGSFQGLQRCFFGKPVAKLGALLIPRTLFRQDQFQEALQPQEPVARQEVSFRTVCITHTSCGQTWACSESSKPYVPRYQAIKSVCSVDKRCVVVKEAHTATVQLGGFKLMSSRFCVGQLSCQLRLHGLCTKRVRAQGRDSESEAVARASLYRPYE